MTNLRKRMLEELQRRNYSEKTIRGYLRTVEQFAKHFGKSPDKLGPDELRSYQAYLLTERKLAVGKCGGPRCRVAVLLRSHPQAARVLGRVALSEGLEGPASTTDGVSLDEVARLIDAAGNLMQRALLIRFTARACGGQKFRCSR